VRCGDVELVGDSEQGEVGEVVGGEVDDLAAEPVGERERLRARWR